MSGLPAASRPFFLQIDHQKNPKIVLYIMFETYQVLRYRVAYHRAAESSFYLNTPSTQRTAPVETTTWTASSLTPHITPMVSMM